MKKISIILAICLLLMVMGMTVSANAAEGQGNTYTMQDVTVKFDANSKFTPEEQHHIAELLVYGSDKISPCGLSCFLFGHDYKSEITTTITHRARTTAPRCLSKTYEVSVCSKCGDMQQTLISSIYINCCS